MEVCSLENPNISGSYCHYKVYCTVLAFVSGSMVLQLFCKSCPSFEMKHTSWMGQRNPAPQKGWLKAYINNGIIIPTFSTGDSDFAGPIHDVSFLKVENQQQDDAEDFPKSGGGRDLVASDCQIKARLVVWLGGFMMFS